MLLTLYTIKIQSLPVFYTIVCTSYIKTRLTLWKKELTFSLDIILAHMVVVEFLHIVILLHLTLLLLMQKRVSQKRCLKYKIEY